MTDSVENDLHVLDETRVGRSDATECTHRDPPINLRVLSRKVKTNLDESYDYTQVDSMLLHVCRQLLRVRLACELVTVAKVD